jgi:hypothetical protein
MKNIVDLHWHIVALFLYRFGSLPNTMGVRSYPPLFYLNEIKLRRVYLAAIYLESAPTVEIFPR